MNKKLAYFFTIVIFSSCQFFDFGKKVTTLEKPIASVYNNYLYSKDIESLIPKNASKSDSILVVKSIINTWAIKELLKQKAAENLTSEENTTYNKLVQDYKESLFVNGYKERLIKQQLDTVILKKK